MKKILFRRGFTLIELLVVIAIIGILTAIVTANFSTAKSKTRDAKKVSDLAQIQLTLEKVFDRCGKYPPKAGAGGIDETIILCSSNNENYTVDTFISKVPTNYGIPYDYQVNGAQTDYILRATLENSNAVLTDSYKNLTPVSTELNMSCSGALEYCVVPK